MFISFEKELKELITTIVCNPLLHGRWLNTLSYLENCGARKIASCEHPTQVKVEMLKHASEEFRHALYLKKQLKRINQHYEDYQLDSLLGGIHAYQYLNALDLQTSRFLNQKKELAYLLVTYSIELRAAELYPIYQAILKEHKSPIQVQSILLEEKEHLQEMQEGLSKIPNSPIYINEVCKIEALLFKKWLSCCQNLRPVSEQSEAVAKEIDGRAFTHDMSRNLL